MARLDTLQVLFVSMDSCIDARLRKMETQMDDLTFSVQQLTSLIIPSRQRIDFVTPTDTNLEVDGRIEVIGSSSNTRVPIVAYETMPILQTSGDATTKIFTLTIDIPDSAGQVDGEIFIHATDTSVDIIIRDDPPIVQVVGEAVTPIIEITNQATTPILEDIDQVATLVLEEIDGVVDPIIVT